MIPRAPETAPPLYHRTLRPPSLIIEETGSPVSPASPSPAQALVHQTCYLAANSDISASVYSASIHSGDSGQFLTVPFSPEGAAANHVQFKSPVESVRAVTPYAQVYGVHPKYFHINSDGHLQATPQAASGAMGPAGVRAAAKMARGRLQNPPSGLCIRSDTPCMTPCITPSMTPSMMPGAVPMMSSNSSGTMPSNAAGMGAGAGPFAYGPAMPSPAPGRVHAWGEAHVIQSPAGTAYSVSPSFQTVPAENWLKNGGAAFDAKALGLAVGLLSESP